MDKKQKREISRKKKTKHLRLMKTHGDRRDAVIDAFNLANYKIDLHCNPDHHAQMKEDTSS